jgi:hypothetical protein
MRTKIWIWVLGLLFMQAFVICILGSFFHPLSPATRRLLEVLLPGFEWLTLAGFLIGLAESFVAGVYVAVLLLPVVRVFYLKHHHFPPAHHGSARSA